MDMDVPTYHRANGPLGSSKDYKNATQRAMLLGPYLDIYVCDSGD